MAEVVVLRNPLDASRRRRCRLADRISLLDWVEREEPAGGHLTRAVYVNGRPCTDVTYRTQPGDEVLVAFAPGATVAPYIVQAIVAFVIGYALNTLFAPKRPNAGSLPSPSQVYGIAPPKNAARLGQPIPVIYGSVIALPDFAAQPYTYFAQNDQFMDALLCVGLGDHDVTAILFADTSGAPLPPDVVQWRAFRPSDHGSRFGVVQGQTGVRENVVTSPAVGTQELFGQKESGVWVASTWYWALSNVRTSTGTSGTVLINATTPAAKIALLPANPPLGSQIGCTIGFDGSLYTLGTYTATAYSPAQTPAAGALIPAPTFDTTPGIKWVGPFECCKVGQTGTSIEIDFVHPKGLYGTSQGNIVFASVMVQMVWEQIDANGNVIAGGGGNVYFNPGGATTTPQRRTFTQAVPSGRYRVKCGTIGNGGGDSTGVGLQVIWAGLKFQLDPPPASQVVYGNVTLVAVRLKASNGIAADAAASMRFRVTRRLPPLGSGTAAPTSNPADAFVDILCAPYGGARPVTGDEIDLPELTASRSAWDGANGFNAVFDQASTVWEALGLAVQAVHAAPLPVGSRMSLMHDAVQPVRATLFTDESIVAGSLKVNQTFDRIGTPAGVRVNWRDPITFEEAVVLQPPLVADYSTIDLFGCTSLTVAQQHAALALAKRAKQRSSIEFECELEGLNILPGDRIGVSARMVHWAQSARVESVDGLVLTLSKPLVWTAGQPHAVLLRTDEGTAWRVFGVTPGEADNILVLPSLPFIITGANEPQEATAISFGVQDHEVTDWIVTKVTPNGTTVTLEAVNYDPSIYSVAADFTRRIRYAPDVEELRPS